MIRKPQPKPARRQRHEMLEWMDKLTHDAVFAAEEGDLREWILAKDPEAFCELLADEVAMAGFDNWGSLQSAIARRNLNHIGHALLHIFDEHLANTLRDEMAEVSGFLQEERDDHCARTMSRSCGTLLPGFDDLGGAA